MKICRNKGEDISPNMFGLFFEDINFAADGGLYAELVENRSFEAREAFGKPGNFYLVDDFGYAWSPIAAGGELPSMKYVTGTPLSTANPHYLRFVAGKPGQGFSNKAYDGICLKKGTSVNVSLYARKVDYEGGLTISVSENGSTVSKASISLKTMIPFQPFADVVIDCDVDWDGKKAEIQRLKKLDKNTTSYVCEWVKYEAKLSVDRDIKGGVLNIVLDNAGIMEFDFISAIPDDAVAGVFRKDIFDALKAMNPGFIRFPGGCIVEGMSLDNRYYWKQTVGRNIDRRYIQNLWAFNDDRNAPSYDVQRSDPHYGQSYGIGFYEFFLLCELLGAKPLPVLSVGIACQFRSTELTDIDSEEFEKYVQDAVDLIEFANGPVTSKWGALRASMGHPESFNMDMIAVGNEQWETDMVNLYERNNRFEKAIHEAYPGFKIIGSVGPDVDMPTNEQSWEYYRKGKKANPDFCYAVDEHYYKSPEWMYNNVTLYDKYPRDIYVFAGEYATHTASRGNNMESALAEAAVMTGLEKNAGVVKLASYAPLFNRIGHSQWKPDMIWFDAEKVYLTPDYYVQKLYSNNIGDHTLVMGDDIYGLRDKGVYVSLSETKDGEVIIKAVNTNNEEFVLSLEDENGKPVSSDAKISVLLSTGPEPEGMPEPSEVRESVEKLDGKLVLKAKSFTVARY